MYTYNALAESVPEGFTLRDVSIVGMLHNNDTDETFLDLTLSAPQEDGSGTRTVTTTTTVTKTSPSATISGGVDIELKFPFLGSVKIKVGGTVTTGNMVSAQQVEIKEIIDKKPPRGPHTP